MRRRPGFVPFIVLLPPLVLAGGLLFWLYASVRHTLQHVPFVLQRQLSAYLGREVRVGRIESDIWNGVTLYDVAIAREKRLADGALLRVPRIRVRYSLEAALYYRQPPLETVQKIEVDSPWLFVKRDARGHLNLMDLVKPGPPQKGPPQRFLGVVIVRRGTVIFEDHKVPGGRTLTHHLTGIEARVDARALPLYAASLSLNADADRLRSLRLAATVDPGRKSASVVAHVRGMKIPFWLAYKPASVRLRAQIHGGEVDLDATALVLGGKVEDYRAQVALRDGAASTDKLGRPVSGLTARLDVGPDTCVAQELHAKVGKLELSGQATVLGFKHPTLRGDLRVGSVQEADVREVVPNLPPLPDLRLGRVNNLELLFGGTLADPQVRLRADLSSLERPEAKLSAIHVQARLVGRKSVVVEEASAQVAGGKVTATGSVDVSGAKPRYELRGAVRAVHLEALHLSKALADAPPAGTVSADFEVSGEGADPQARARVDLTDASFKEWHADSLQGEVAYRGPEKKIELGRLQVRTPEGMITAHGTVDLKGPLQIQVAATGLDLGAIGRHLKMKQLHGEAYLHGEVKGSLTDPNFTGEVAGYDIGWGEDTVQMVRGTLTADRNGAKLEECRAFMPPIQMGNVSASLVDMRAGADAELTATGTIIGIDLGMIAQRLKLQGDWAGRLDLENLEVSGPLNDLKITASATGEDLRLAGNPIDYATGRLVVGLDGSVQVPADGALTLRAGGRPTDDSEARLWGSIGADRQLDLHLSTAEGKSLRIEDFYLPDPWMLHLKSQLVLDDVRITGPAANPRVRSDRPECVDIRELEINGIPFGLGYAEFDASKDSVVIRDVKIAGKQRPPRKPGAGQGTDTPAGGTVTAAAAQSPDEKPEVYELSGEAFPHVNLTAVVQKVSIFKLIRLARQQMPPEPYNPSGRITGLIRIREGKPRPQVRLENIVVEEAKLGTQPFSTLRAEGAALESDAFTLKALEVAVPGGGSVSVSGKAPLDGRGEMAFTVAGKQLDLAMARSWVTLPAPIEGRCDVSATIGGTLSAPTLEGSVALDHPRYGERGLEKLAGKISYQGNLATLTGLEVQRGIYRVSGEARIPFDWQKKAIPADAPLSAHFALAEQSLEGLALLSPRVIQSKGTFSAKLDIGGTLAQPDLNGLALVRADEIILGNREQGKEPEKSLRLAGVDGAIRLERDRVVVDHLTLASGEKGKVNPRALALTGEVTLKQFVPDEFNLRLVAQDYAFSERNLSAGIQEDIRFTLNGQGTVRNSWPYPQIEGDFRLHHARVDVSRYMAPPAGPERQPFAVSPLFNVRVATADDAEVIAPRTRAYVALDTSLRGDLNEPKLSGTAKASRGSVNLPTAHFRLQEANVDFRVEPPEPFTATGKAVLTTRLRGSQAGDRPPQTYNVTATVDLRFPQVGSEPIKMELAAQPFLEETDIYRLLTRQDVIESIIARQGNVEDTIKKEAMQYLATALQPQVIEPVERAIADALGLSEFSISAAFEEPVEVKVGKYLVQGLRVSYTRAVSARETSYKFKVDYEVIPRISLSWSTDQERSQTIGLEAGLRF